MKALHSPSTAEPIAVLESLDSELARNPSAGEATCIYLRIENGRIFGASVGDSAALLLKQGEEYDLTARQHRKPLLGSGIASPVAFEHCDADGRVLVASDGLWNYAPYSSILGVARSEPLSEVPARLIDICRLRSGSLQDDISVAICELKP